MGTKPWILLIILESVLIAITAPAQTGENVNVRVGIDHSKFDLLLKKYVNEQGLVNYGAWKQSTADLSDLDNYLKQFAAKIDNSAQGNEKAASLVSAYNAFVLRWILSNYPTESIWQLKDSFSAKRNEIGGGKVSLDDIEHGALRPLIGYRAHAVLVCAARSCPPLQRFAYTADGWRGMILTNFWPTRRRRRSPVSSNGSSRISTKPAASRKFSAATRQRQCVSSLRAGITRSNIFPTTGA